MQRSYKGQDDRSALFVTSIWTSNKWTMQLVSPRGNIPKHAVTINEIRLIRHNEITRQEPETRRVCTTSGCIKNLLTY